MRPTVLQPVFTGRTTGACGCNQVERAAVTSLF
jgi:hypothetical protein